MRSDWKLTRNAVGLCLPTVLVVALSVFFYLDKLPEIEKGERNRVRDVYRETAQTIRQNPSDYAMKALPKEWKPAGKMAPGRWGFSPDTTGRSVCVWYEKDGESRFAVVSSVSETDYRMVFTVFGGAFLLILICMTAFGIRFFVRYMRSRDDFLAATAHDLTTPLVGMRMTIGRDDAEARRLNERMLLIVGNIKDFLRLGGRRRKPDLKSVDIVALTHEAYSLFAADYEDSEGGPVVFRSCSPVNSNNSNNPNNSNNQTIPFVRADETLTLQILWNLFGNDLKYAAPYGKVTVRILPDGRFVRIEFADEGPGMTPRQMRHAFDRYYRAKSVLESGKGGFGIGLCASREFARAMGGDLTVRANGPKGCVFRLSLPLC